MSQKSEALPLIFGALVNTIPLLLLNLGLAMNIQWQIRINHTHEWARPFVYDW
jgi:hypothetical protein